MELLDWAIDRVFTLDTLTELLTEPRADWNRYLGRHAEEVHTWRVQAASSAGWGSDDADRVTAWMQRRMATLQPEDRAYWRPIINRLKQLRLD